MGSAGSTIVNNVSNAYETANNSYNKVAETFVKVTKIIGKKIENVAVDIFQTVTDKDIYLEGINKTKEVMSPVIDLSEKAFDESIYIIEDGIDITEDVIGVVTEEAIIPAIGVGETGVEWINGAGKTTWSFLEVVYGDTTDFLVDIGVPRNAINTFNEGVVVSAHTVKEYGYDEPITFLDEVCTEKIPEGWGKLDDYNETKLVKDNLINIIRTADDVGVVLYKNAENRDIRSLVKNASIGIPIILLSSLINFNATINGIGAIIGNYCRLAALELGCDEQTSNYIGYSVTLTGQIYMFNKINGGGLGAGSRGGVGVLAGVSGKVLRKILIRSGSSKEVQDIASYVSLLVVDILLTGSLDASKEQIGTDILTYKLNEIQEKDSKTAKDQGHDIKSLIEFNFTPLELKEEGFTADEINNASYIINNKIGRKSLLDLRLKDGSQFITATITNDSTGVYSYNFKLIKSFFFEDINFPSNINSENASFHMYDGDTFNGNNEIIKIRTKTSGIFSNNFTKFQKPLNSHNGVIYNLGIEGGEIGTIGGGFFYKQNQKYVEINNCFSTGNINKKGSGGIIGKGCNNAIVKQCYSHGLITGENAGGIVGSFFGYMDTNVLTKQQLDNNDKNILDKKGNKSEIINCYSIGKINGTGSGGICGGNAGSGEIGNAMIRNCFSAGNILGTGAGGITGSYSAKDLGLLRIDTVFSLGEISGVNSGGIIGSNVCTNNGRFILTNCYTTGNLHGKNTGGLVGYINPINKYEPHGQSYPALENILIDDLVTYETISKNTNKQFMGTIINSISYGSNNYPHNSVVGYDKNNYDINYHINVKNCYGNYNKNITNFLNNKLFNTTDIFSDVGQKRLYTTYINGDTKQKSSSFIFKTVTSSSISKIKIGNETTETTTVIYTNYFYLKQFKNDTSIWNSSNYNIQTNSLKLKNMPNSNLSYALPSTDLLLLQIDTITPIYNLFESEILNNITVKNNRLVPFDEDILIIRSILNGKEVDIMNDIISNKNNILDLFIFSKETEKLERLIISLHIENPHINLLLESYFYSIFTPVEGFYKEKYDLLYYNKENMLKYGDHVLIEDNNTISNVIKRYNEDLTVYNKGVLCELTNNIELTEIKKSLLNNNLLNIIVKKNNVVNIKYNSKTEKIELLDNMLRKNNKLYKINSIIKIHDELYKIKGFGSVLLEKITPQRINLMFINTNAKGSTKSIGSKYSILGNRRR
jgi:hypothetical protein